MPSPEPSPGPGPGRVSRLKLGLGLGLLVALVGIGGCALRDAVASEAEEIYAALMCNCGCNQVLGVCNHIGCPNAVPMRAEVDAHLADGKHAEEILALFVDKYGLSILSAPPTSGWFNVSGWLMPFFALTVGLGLLGFYLHRFRGRWTDPRAESGTTPDALERLEEELAYFDPKD
jgi:cytochrome c-type biogenesis protein CcmH/NrfF